MRILIVTMLGFSDEFSYSHQDQTAYTLAELRHEVFAYAYLDKKSPQHSISCQERKGVKVRRFSPPERIISLCLRNALKQDGPFNIIHLHHLRNKFSYEITRYALGEDIPLIFEPHGLLHDPYLVKNRDFPFSGPILEDNLILTQKALIKRLIMRGPFPRYFKNYSQHFTLKKADTLIAISRHERDFLSRITGHTDIEIIPHWVDRDIIGKVDRDSFKLNLEKPYILFVGQLKYRRGFDIALKAFSRIKKDFPLASLIIVTNNPDKKNELLCLARKEGIYESLLIKERISEEEKLSLYKQADLYLSPTRYEGFGVTFLEAMASGCPIVASDIPVVREIVEDEKTGLLARLEDPFDFYKKIKRLLTDHSLRENLIKNALQKIEKEYNKEKIFAKLLNIYAKEVQ